MKQHALVTRIRFAAVAMLLLSLGLLLFSFTEKRFADSFLQELGISKTAADQKITNSLLGGYLDQYGLQNAKNIALGNRGRVANDLLAYTKQYTGSPAFKQAYQQLREQNRPTPSVVQTPEAMRKGLIDQYTKSLAETEANMKKADPSMKTIFEPIIATLKQQIKDMQDPNNAMIATYKENYAEMLASLEASSKQQLVEWEAKYPANQQLFIKLRLQQFLEETSSIDFNAPLIEKNGKKYFVNPNYEHKGNRWKLAFRSGKEVVETARQFVREWLGEIK
jgi:hypothetical protein